MDSKRWPKILALAALVAVLLGAVLFFVVNDYKERELESERLAAYMAESYEYRLQRQNLTIEYENIEKYTLNRLADGSFIGIVFRGLDPQLYTSAFPLMRDREYPVCGMLCLSEGSLPDDEGCITREQFDEIIACGWDTALYYTGEGDGELEPFLVKMRGILNSRGIDMPKTVLFAKGQYISSYDTLLYSYGIENAMHHGDDNKVLIEGDVDGKIWHPGALAWNTKGFSSAMLTELVSVGGCAYLEAEFNTDSFQLLYDANKHDRTAAFGRMLSKIESFIANDRLESKPLSEARAGRLAYLSKKEDLLEEIGIRKQQILDEIDAIDAIISEIYKKHHKE